MGAERGSFGIRVRQREGEVIARERKGTKKVFPKERAAEIRRARKIASSILVLQGLLPKAFKRFGMGETEYSVEVESTPREYRHACAVLAGYHYSSWDLARGIVRYEERIVLAQAFAEFSRERIDEFTECLARTIADYYPGNSPKKRKK